MTSDRGQPARAIPPSRPVKRSFTLAGHRTSISLEAAFWDALREAAAAEGVSLAALVGRIDAERGAAGLSGAVRVWVLDYYRRAAVKRTTATTGSPSAHRTASWSPGAAADAAGEDE
jgi:predicted DNA-binding ribbon-helix-helix protein